MGVSYVRTLSRFYYSLLISVLMHTGSFQYTAGKKKNVSGWLNNARRRKLFIKVVLRDIEWLKEQNARLHPDELAVNLVKIYRSSRFICLAAGIMSEE